MPSMFVAGCKPAVLTQFTIFYSHSWPELYMYTVSEGVFDDLPAKKTIYTVYVWFWPTLFMVRSAPL